MISKTTLFDTLQSEFCPPLDTSLLAALLAELQSDAQGKPLVPTPRQIDELRATLCELSSQADESQLCEFSGVHLTSQTDDSTSIPEFYHGNTATTSSLDSSSSDSSRHSFSSPLGFLQAALPHISTETLSSALEEADDIDMWDIVAGILTAQFIREMEERGLDMPEEDDQLPEIWETVENKKKVVPKSRAGKKRTARGKTITLGDVRQQQHVQYAPKRSNESNPVRSPAASDTWTQIASLSSHLASLLPPHPSSFFQSYFHSPEYPTPYNALRSCLNSICASQSSEIMAEEYIDTLFMLVDILRSEYESLDNAPRSRLISDVEISLQATNGRGDDALDLAKLLRDLDSDSTGYLEMGIYHVAPCGSPVEARKAPKQSLPSGPPPIQPPPQLRPKPKPPPSKKPSPYQWQSVPQRRTSHSGPHPLAPYIPSYTRDVNGVKVKGAGNAFGQGGKGDVGELGEYKRRMGESMRKRNELLKQATRMWQRGNSKTRGGEVAFYFAERAREFQELAKAEALNAARTMVESKRLSSNDPYSVDLHGTTASEAIIIVKETLEALSTSPGRGSHSVNQVSVLKPAVKKALVEDGWLVGSWDGGLVVRGKR
ncbi:hypothetical protein H0H81_011897 [Sphagnurus paluster]|uniref:Smr domain-containing protein n=1 Tax=Sphagnurus paluster TaxID=117069 RepID=A0A9P7K890_9AGAR|nr:hypothetical protein H0H81_011897 [Sphagnurus paluster]